MRDHATAVILVYRCSSKQGENMAANELETHQIGDKQYVTLQDAARYLGISKRWLEDMTLPSKIMSSSQRFEIPRYRAASWRVTYCLSPIWWVSSSFAAMFSPCLLEHLYTRITAVAWSRMGRFEDSNRYR